MTSTSNRLLPARMGTPAVGGFRRSDLTESSTIVIDTSPALARQAVCRVDLAAPLSRALYALDATGRFALLPARVSTKGPEGLLLLGTIWRIDARAAAERVPPERFESFSSPGYVKVRWVVDVTELEGGAELSVHSSFVATDDRSSQCLFDAWSLVGPLFHALVEHAARSVEAYAEELEEE